MSDLNFLVTAFIVVLSPGTGALFTISTGLAQGRRASLFAALGCTAGIVPHLLATILGLAAVMHTSALAFQILKYAGVAYLFCVACATWRDRTAFSLAQDAPRCRAGSLVMKALLLNLLNPKLTIFFLAFLPQFVRPHADTSPIAQMLVLSTVFMAMTLVVFAGYGLLAHALRRAVLASRPMQNWLRRGFAACFAGLGAGLAYSD